MRTTTLRRPVIANQEQFTDRYVSLWNEPDAAARRKLITELWAPDGANYTASSEYHGYEELESRVTDAYERFVRSGTYRFRSLNQAVSHHGAMRLHWEMIDTQDDAVASIGLEVFILDANGRILSDHQFIEQ